MQIDSDSDQPGQQEEEGVWKILTRQQIEGVEDSFLVQLVEGGKKVRVSSYSLSLSLLLLSLVEFRTPHAKGERGRGQADRVK